MAKYAVQIDADTDMQTSWYDTWTAKGNGTGVSTLAYACSNIPPSQDILCFRDNLISS